MLVDLSHVSPATAHSALDASTAPVIFSQSSSHGVTANPRTVPDDVLVCSNSLDAGGARRNGPLAGANVLRVLRATDVAFAGADSALTRLPV